MKINNKYIAKYKKGFPLLFTEALESPNLLPEQGSIIDFTDYRGNFICKGVIGKQNKGLGWILTLNQNENIDIDFFHQKLKSAIDFRADFFDDNSTNCFRIFNGEGDGIGGFTVDYFAGFILINWYNEGIYKYNNEIVGSLEKLLKVKGFYEKKRFSKNSKDLEETSFVKGSQAPDPLIVHENNLKFAIHLEDGAMVGVFLDQREVRQKIQQQYAKNKSVLNAFSYTGAFSIFAAKGGAKSTTSVDLAKRSLQKTKEHFSINNISLEDNRIVVEDIFSYFKYAVRKELKFDMVILDPPSFARSKKIRFSAAKNYPALLKEAISITRESGVIVASTNCSTFDIKKFESFILEGFDGDNTRYKIIERFKLPADFRTNPEFQEGNYLKVIFIRLK